MARSINISIRFNEEKDADLLEDIAKYKNASLRIKELLRAGISQPAPREILERPARSNNSYIPPVSLNKAVIETKKELSKEDLKKNLLGGF